MGLHVVARRQMSSFIERRCTLLGLRSACPFISADGLVGDVEFAAYLPQFGGPKGILVDIVIDPDYTPGEAQKRVAAELRIPVSFVNPASFLRSADEFILALRDWGYFGLPAELTEAARNALAHSKE